MLKVISDQSTIKKCCRHFLRQFKPFIDEKIKVKLGHQGASLPAKILWSKKLGIWLSSRAVNEVRYWNAFGAGKPRPGNVVPIITEINFPFNGIDRKTGGAFARDSWGNVFVVHRGKIGGGKKGVGKSFFENNYRGVWSFMEDGNDVTQVAVIGALNSPHLAWQTAHFVKKVEMLKSTAVDSPQMEINFSETRFREDLIGDIPSAEEPDCKARCDRDLIMCNLAAFLQNKKFKTGNDTNHKLFLLENSKNRKSHIFEVLTDAHEKEVLAAAAKLLIQTANDRGNPKPILILPEKKVSAYSQILQKLSIIVTGYYWNGDKIIFPELEKIKLDQNHQL
jgi:hypothetical protein